MSTLYTTNKSGYLEILYEHSSRKVLVRFTKTGYIRLATRCHIKEGSVQDPYYPRHRGVGYIGIGRFTRTNYPQIYNLWASLMQRCYDSSFHKLHPTYAECVVAKEWHCLQDFGSWYEINYPRTKGDWQLDKDILVKNNKVYGPNTCKFVTRLENNLESYTRPRKDMQELTLRNILTNDIITFTNKTKFAKEHNLHPSGIHALIRGRLKTYKNWELY